ncbi:MAG: protein-tyrosine phosphatase [Gammaproteobacteria bacterium]
MDVVNRSLSLRGKRFVVPVNTPGEIFMMRCPPGGAKLDRAIGSLAKDGLHFVVSLLPDNDAAALGVVDEAALCARHGVEFYRYPITDFGLPTDATRFAAVLDEVVSQLRTGANGAVHCRAGIGRTGLLVGAVLVRLGQTPDAAITAMSAARGVESPESKAQREWLRNFC